MGTLHWLLKRWTKQVWESPESSDLRVVLFLALTVLFGTTAGNSISNSNSNTQSVHINWIPKPNPPVPVKNKVPTKCNKGWVEFNGFCFGFSDEAVNWLLAASTCNYYGARLVEIESQTKQNWLVKQLKARNTGITWVGGSKRHSGNWEWIPAFKSISVYLNWGPGEPNGATTDRCLNIYPDHDYKWNDADCLNNYKFVCEKRVKAT